MNDSDKLKDLASDLPSQNKFQNKKLHIEKILQKRVDHVQRATPQDNVAQEVPDDTSSDGNKLEEASRDLHESRRTSHESGESPQSDPPSKPIQAPSSVSKIAKIQVLSQHALVGACILFLILFTLPTFLNTISWLTEKTKPLAITVTWFVVMLIANIIFVVSKK